MIRVLLIKIWLKVKQIISFIIYKIINFILSVLIISIRPMVKVIITDLPSERIGHLAHKTDYFLRRLQLDLNYNQSKTVFIAIAQYPPANLQLMKMFMRSRFIISLPTYLYNIVVNSIKNNKSIYIDFIPSANYNNFILYKQTNDNLHFTSIEEERGKKLLQQMGISEKDWFVCFHTRDSSYLQKNAGRLYGDWGNKRDWSYHDYRDSSINTFISAAEFIAQQGGFAVRMGKDTDECLPEGLHPNIIDYSNKYCSDFGDIYLCAKCKFMIGSSSGLEFVPIIFNRPVIYTNFIPLGAAVTTTREDTITIPSKIWSENENRYLTYREILNSEIANYHQTKQYLDAGLKVVPSSAEEILDVTKEMYARVFVGGYEYQDEDKNLREQFRSLYPSTHICYNNDVPISEMIGIDFLRKNKELIY